VLLRRLVAFESAPRSMKMRGAMVAAALLLPAASWQLAELEQMEGSGNAYADELAGNGLFCFAAAMHRNELDYQRWYATLPQEEADDVLRDLHVERLPLSSPDSPSAMDDPPHDKVPFSRRPRNVVLVTIESMSAEYRRRLWLDRGADARAGSHRCRRVCASLKCLPPARARCAASKRCRWVRRRYRAGHRAPHAQQQPVDAGRTAGAAGRGADVHLRWLRLLRQHEQLFPGQRLQDRRSHRLSRRTASCSRTCGAWPTRCCTPTRCRR
jgi:hypothetical protein